MQKILSGISTVNLQEYLDLFRSLNEHLSELELSQASMSLDRLFSELFESNEFGI
jgi:hypothetical protein